jgi:hypothetical protein
MQSHILVLGATTKFSNKSFVFKKNVVKKGLPESAVTGLGAGGPRFKSGRPDHLPTGPLHWVDALPVAARSAGGARYLHERVAKRQVDHL